MQHSGTPKQEKATVYWHVKWGLEVEKNVTLKAPERRVQTPEADLHSCKIKQHRSVKRSCSPEP